MTAPKHSQKTTTTTKTDTCDSRSYKGSWVIDSKRQNYSLIHLSIHSFIPQRYMTLSICHGQDSARYKTQIWKSIKRDKYIKKKIVKQCRNNRFKEVWSGELGYQCHVHLKAHTQDLELCLGLYLPLSPHWPSCFGSWYPLKMCLKQQSFSLDLEGCTHINNP